MIGRLNKSLICFVAVFAIGFACWVVVKVCSASDSNDVPNIQKSDVNSAPAEAKPMIIWFHSGSTGKLESLRHVISSGLVTHVLLLYMHRADADWKTNPDVQKAIEMVKKSGLKLIWCRNLWPYYANDGIKLNDFFDPNYYVKEIQALRSEAKDIGADFVCLDNEPYGRSIMKRYLKSKEWPSAEEMENLRRAVSKAVAIAGKADFVLPAGSAQPGHPYYVLDALGNFQISEYTYHDKKRRRNIVKRPNEIFGAYVNVSRENTLKPDSPYFLVSDIFERSELWSGTKGLFLYTDGSNEPAVAEALADYAKRLSRKDSLKSEEPN